MNKGALFAGAIGLVSGSVDAGSALPQTPLVDCEFSHVVSHAALSDSSEFLSDLGLKLRRDLESVEASSLLAANLPSSQSFAQTFEAMPHDTSQSLAQESFFGHESDSLALGFAVKAEYYGQDKQSQPLTLLSNNLPDTEDSIFNSSADLRAAEFAAMAKYVAPGGHDLKVRLSTGIPIYRAEFDRKGGIPDSVKSMTSSLFVPEKGSDKIYVMAIGVAAPPNEKDSDILQYVEKTGLALKGQTKAPLIISPEIVVVRVHSEEKATKLPAVMWIYEATTQRAVDLSGGRPLFSNSSMSFSSGLTWDSWQESAEPCWQILNLGLQLGDGLIRKLEPCGSVSLSPSLSFRADVGARLHLAGDQWYGTVSNVTALDKNSNKLESEEFTIERKGWLAGVGRKFGIFFAELRLGKLKEEWGIGLTIGGRGKENI